MIKSPGLAVGAAVKCPKCGKGFRVGEGAEAGSRKSEDGRRSAEDERRGTGGESRQGTREGVQGSKPRVHSSPGAPPPVKSVPGPSPAKATDASDSPAAAALKPRRPDNLVDPNLLPPPPPRVKPKPQEVPVVCHVCGTRMYAKLDKIGQEVKCPDCFTRLKVPPLAASEAGKAAGPTLEGAEEYAMSDVVERPKYRPLQNPRGEYDVLSAMDPAAMEHRLTVSGGRPRTDKQDGTQATGERRVTGERVTVEPVDEDEAEAGDSSDDEIAIEPPVERVQLAPDPRTIMPNPQMEEENALYDGRYDDGLIGDGVAAGSPDAWKRAPMMYGIVEFLFYPSTLLRWAGFSIGTAMAAVIVHRGVEMVLEGDAKILFVLWGGIPVVATVLISFAAAMFAVVSETGNGENEVSSWPDWRVFEWFLPAAYICGAAIVSGLPGGVIAGMTLAGSLKDPAMAAFGIAAPLLLSWLVLFPIVLYSMLAENSLLAVFSSQVGQSFRAAGDAWMYFYMYSIVIFVVGGIGVGMMALDGLLIKALAASGVVGLVFLYLRILGRLMWSANQRLAKSGYAG